MFNIYLKAVIWTPSEMSADGIVSGDTLLLLLLLYTVKPDKLIYLFLDGIQDDKQ